MTAFYPLLTVISIAVSVWLARRFALARNRTVLGWALAGAFFPPLLVILYLLKPVEAEASTTGDEEAET